MANFLNFPIFLSSLSVLVGSEERLERSYPPHLQEVPQPPAGPLEAASKTMVSLQT